MSAGPGTSQGVTLTLPEDSVQTPGQHRCYTVLVAIPTLLCLWSRTAMDNPSRATFEGLKIDSKWCERLESMAWRSGSMGALMPSFLGVGFFFATGLFWLILPGW